MSAMGSCECGAVNYTLTGNADVYACHCLNCQTRTGSAFAEHAMIHVSQFECRGATVAYERSVGGVASKEVFCRTCHTRIFNMTSALPELIILCAGTMAGSQPLEPVAHIWAKRKQAWLSLPEGVPVFDESPTPEQFRVVLQAAQKRRSGES
ncbi:MAG TPA: GFA family protein [Acidocella sp.]|jgi:hypothetical protein|nr:GFA family protein [Acidocella sp.]